MNCWSCGTELIWGGDHNGEDEGRDGDDGSIMVIVGQCV